MILLPIKTNGIVAVSTAQQVHYLNRRWYIIICNFSSIYQYEISKMKLSKKSPFLHYNNSIKCILMIKNRTFATISTTLHILDFFIPITRVKLFSGPITNLVKVEGGIFLFSTIDQKGFLLDVKTLSILKFLRPKTKILFLSKNQKTLKKNLLLFYTQNSSIEIWNINLMKNICSFNFNLSFSPTEFFIKNDRKNIFLNLPKNFLFIFNMKKKKKRIYKNKKFKEFQHLIYLKNKSDNCLIKCKNNLYIMEKKKIYHFKLRGHYGEISFLKILENRLLLSIGLYDNTIALHALDEKSGRFNLLKKKSGKNFPIQKFNDFKANKFIRGIETQMKKNNSNYKSKQIDNGQNLRSPNSIMNHLPVKQIIIKPDIFNIYHYTIIVLFFNSPNIQFWEFISNTKFLGFSSFLQNRTIISNVSCLSVSNKIKIAILGYEDNLLSFIDIVSKKFLFHGQNHKFFDLNYRCKIKFCEIDFSDTLFISYCSHGILNLWDLSKLKIEKTLILKGLDFLKWSPTRDLMYVSGITGEIYLIFPQNFHIIKVLKNHSSKIMDLSLFKDKYLISSSLDKTVVLWDLLENKCCDRIKFKFCPISLEINNKDYMIYLGHENTIGISKWSLKSFEEIDKHHKIKIFLTKNKNNKEKNFTFLKYNLDTMSPLYSLEKNDNYLRKRKKKFFLQGRKTYVDLSSNFLEYFEKIKKKKLLGEIKMLNVKIKKKTKFQKKKQNQLFVFLNNLSSSYFLILEKIFEDFIWEKLEHNFMYFLSEFFSFLNKTNYLRKIFIINFKKFLIDIINII